MIPAELARARFISVTTFRKSGAAVSTPLWFAVAEERIVIWTGESSGKIKRLRHNPAVTVQRCDARGRTQSAAPVYTGTAVILDRADGPSVHAALDAKYTWQKRGLRWLNRIGTWFGRKDSALDDAFISIALDDAPDEAS